jgi:hypothetical protein
MQNIRKYGVGAAAQVRAGTGVVFGSITGRPAVGSTKKTSAYSSTDSHPSDKNKDVRWMGHSFISLGLAKPVDD